MGINDKLNKFIDKHLELTGDKNFDRLFWKTIGMIGTTSVGLKGMAVYNKHKLKQKVNDKYNWSPPTLVVNK